MRVGDGAGGSEAGLSLPRSRSSGPSSTSHPLPTDASHTPQPDPLWPRPFPPIFVFRLLLHHGPLMYLPDLSQHRPRRQGTSDRLFPPASVCTCALSCVSLQPCGSWPTRLLCPWDSPGKNTGEGCHFLLQGIFPTQGLNKGLQGLLPALQAESLPSEPPE